MLLPKQSLAETSLRDRQILVGLFLSKFDKAGLRALGFGNFAEAFNAIGFAIGAKPASIKNYRDEFDPIFSNKRKGWHQRPMRAHCKAISERNKDLSLTEFAAMIQSLVYATRPLALLADQAAGETPAEGSFAKRLITGLAAENYFESVHASLPILRDYALENVSRIGCGFDFKLAREMTPDYLAVEVKGLNDARGTVSLTEKEHRVAGLLKDRFYLFVVRNFRETPSHALYQSPLDSGLVFTRRVKRIVQTTWSLSI